MDGATVMILLACQQTLSGCAPAAPRAEIFATATQCEAQIPGLLGAAARRPGGARVAPFCVPLDEMCGRGLAMRASFSTPGARPLFDMLCAARDDIAAR